MEKIKFEDWDKDLIATQKVVDFVNQFSDNKSVAGDSYKPLYIFCLLLTGWFDTLSRTYDDQSIKEENDSYIITCADDYVELSSEGQIALRDRSFKCPRRAFKFLDLLNFDLP